LYAGIIVGLVDTLGRTFLPMLIREFADRETANAAGPALASMSIYLLMAIVLAWKPQGLFPAHKGSV
jgi:branched-chain amino acid transport system permease protein